MATSTWTTQYTKLRDSMVAERGVGATGPSGKLPKTNALDPFATLVGLLPFVLDGIRRAHGSDKAARYASDADEARADNSHSISILDWLKLGKAQGDDARVRYLPDPLRLSTAIAAAGGAATVSMVAYRVTGHDDEAVKMIVGKWDSAIGRAAMAAGMIGVQPVLSEQQTITWWSSVYQLMIAIELAMATAPDKTWSDVGGAIKHSAQVTGDWVKHEAAPVIGDAAGQAAAVIAEAAGKAGGAAVKGFIGEAGIWAYVAVAVAIYVYTL